MRVLQHVIAARYGVCALVLLIACSCATPPGAPVVHEYRFDADDRLQAIITPDRNRIRYRWNANGYLQEVRYRGGRVRYGYDPAGMLAWVEDRDGAVEYYRDPLGRVTDVLWRRQLERLLRYRHDNAHNIVGVEVYDLERARREGAAATGMAALSEDLPDDEAAWRERRAAVFAVSDWLSKAETFTEYRVRYDYDAAGRLSTVAGPGGPITYSYSPFGRRVERRWPNGGTSAEDFDAAGRVLRVEHRHPSGATLAAFAYSWSDGGELTAIREQLASAERTATLRWEHAQLVRIDIAGEDSIDLAYAETGQLAAARQGTRSVAYTYDDLGRRIQSGNTSWTLDVNGWPESLTIDGASLSIEYDGRGLPIEIDDGQTKVATRFDPMGHLSSVRAGSDERHFLADPLTPADAPLVSWDEAGQRVGSHVYGDQLLLETDASGNARYLLRDGLGAVRLAADQSGSTHAVGFVLWESLVAASVNASRVPSRSAATLDAAWTFPLATLHAAQNGDANTIDWRLRDVDAAALWARFQAEEQYFRQAGFDSSKVPGFLYDQKIQNRFERFLSASRDRSVTVYLKGISNGWAETTADTQLQCPAGDCVFLPTFGSLPNWAHIPATVVEKMIGLPTRKLDMPALIERTRAAGKTLDAIVCESGCGFELQRNVRALERYARANPGVRLPLLVVQSTAIGPTLTERLERAGYTVAVVSEDGIVPRLVASAADYAGILGRVPIVGERIGLPIQLTAATAFVGGQLISGRPIVGPHGVDEHKEPIQALVDAHRFPVRALRDVAPGELSALWHGDGESVDEGGHVPSSLPDRIGALEGLERRLGGIELAARGESEIDAGSIAGLAYDPAKRIAILLGRRAAGSPPLAFADLAVALRLAYQDPPVYPQFSLDPDDPRDPKGQWLKLVHLPESLKGTEFGHTMFMADWLMKQLSFGLTVDARGAITRRSTMPAGLKDIFGLTFDQPHQANDEVWTRLWIVAKDFRWKIANDAVVFTAAHMGVKAKRQQVDPRSDKGLVDVEAAVDPASARFAGDLTSKYEDVAKALPEFARLAELAKLVALARWMRETGVPIDSDWLRQNSAQEAQAIARVSALSDTRDQRSESTSRSGNVVTTRTTTRQLRLFGGVDLTVEPTAVGNPGALGESVTRAHNTAGSGRQSEIQADGRELVTTVLPVNDPGQQVWYANRNPDARGVTRAYDNDGNTTRLTNADGSTFEYRREDGRATTAVETRGGHVVATHHLDSAQRVERSEDASGTITYRRDADGGITGAEHVDAAGRTSTMTASAEEATWTTTSRGYESLTARYDRMGLLAELAVDGPRGGTYSDTRQSSAPRLLLAAVGPSFGSPQTPTAPGPTGAPSSTQSVRKRPAPRLGTSSTAYEVLSYRASSGTAVDAADQKMFDVVKAASTNDTRLLYVGRSDASADREVHVQFGPSQVTLRRDELDRFLQEGDAPAALHDSVSVEDGMTRIVVIAPATTDRGAGADSISRETEAMRMVAALNRTYGHAVSVHLATDTEIGMKNAARMPLVTGPQDVAAVVPPESFQVTDRRYSTRVREDLLKSKIRVLDQPQVVEQGNILMLTGHKDRELLKFIETLGEADALRDKYAILISCGCEGDVTFNSRVVQEHGAIAVHFFPDTINLQAAVDVIKVLAPKIAELRKEGQTFERLLRDAAEAAKEDAPRRLQLEIEKLKHGVTQVSDAREPDVSRPSA